METVVMDVLEQMGTTIGTKMRLDDAHVERSLRLAGRVTQEVLSETIASHPAIIREMITNEVPTPAARRVWDRVGITYTSALRRKLGLSAMRASVMKDAVMPSIGRRLYERVGGEQRKLERLLSVG